MNNATLWIGFDSRCSFSDVSGSRLPQIQTTPNWLIRKDGMPNALACVAKWVALLLQTVARDPPDELALREQEQE